MKLYWRVKINGKWTWRPAEIIEEEEGAVTRYKWYLVRLGDEDGC